MNQKYLENVLGAVDELIEGSRIKKDYPEIFNRDRIGRAKEVDKYVGDDYFIRFSETWMDSQGQEVNKVGVNTKRAWGNPRGVYAYFMGDYKKGNNASFATNSDTAFVLKRKPYGKQIDDIEKLSVNDYFDLINKLADYVVGSDKYPHIETDEDFYRFVRETERDSKNMSHGGILFYLIVRLGDRTRGTEEPDLAMTYIWRTVLGVTFIGDKGNGIIHPSEPSQVLFLDRKAYKVVDELKNKKDYRKLPHGFLRKLPLGKDNWVLNENGKVDVFGDLYIHERWLVNGKIPWVFGKVIGNVYCACHSLTSLKGAPETVGGDFNCNNCLNLESLEGAPESLGGEFYFRGCPKLKLSEIDKLPESYRNRVVHNLKESTFYYWDKKYQSVKE